jgi:CheY-like chemotaxis protein
MQIQNKKSLKMMVIEDEEDIMNLYVEYFSKRGFNVASSSDNANNIVAECEKCQPDICLLDHILEQRSTGIGAAIQILAHTPSMPILFITAYESLRNELPLHHELDNKNIQILVHWSPSLKDSCYF